MTEELQKRFRGYLNETNVDEIDSTWERQSWVFRDFWDKKIRDDKAPPISDADIDEIVLILDKTAKGATKDTMSVARTMIPQGVWRRLFKGIQRDKKLKDALYSVLSETDERKQIEEIDALYRLNKGQKNSLTGASGNAINAMLFAFNPKRYVAIVSLKHRRNVIEHFRLKADVDFDKDSQGTKIVKSNRTIIDGFKQFGIDASPYIVSAFLYKKLKGEWLPGDIEEVEPPQEPRESEPGTHESPESRSSFYMEKELENFLIVNWDRTELAQRYELIEEDGETVSQQYPTEIGKIDILVKDKETGQYVVIELKKNQTSDDTIGQLTRYMGWLEVHRTNGKATKGIIIAAGYDPKLSYALKKVNDVEIYTYEVDFKLKAFNSGLSKRPPAGTEK